jgi:4-amino-4-deoxy-L-arabinose transferase-like glycosyltransferase
LNTPPAQGTPDRWWLKVDRILLLSLVVGTLVRAWAFGQLPTGMNQDETAMGYDAYALFHQGTDRLGIRWPTMLVSWGSGMNPLASYLALPFVGLFGLHIWSVRLPFLLAGVASLPLFFVLLRDTLDRRTARIGVALLAISPWHIMLSRWGLEANLLPFVFLLAVVLLLRSLRRPLVLIPAAMTFATSLYAYGPSYFVVPAFVLLALGYGLRYRLWPVRVVVWAAIAFVILAVPMGLNIAVNSLGWNEIHTPFFTVPKMTGTARYAAMAGTGSSGLLSAAFLNRTADNLKLGYDIFRAQDDGLISNILPGYGVMYWFSPALSLAGLALLAARALGRQFRPSFFLLVWAAAAIGLLAVISVNVNRANILWLPFIGCVAVASEVLSRKRPLAILLALGFGASFFGFVGTYFGRYQQLEAPKFYTAFGDAIRYASAKTGGEICITDQPAQPYVFVLFFNREDPRVFQRTVRYTDPHADFHVVESFSRYRFGIDRCKDSAPVLIVPSADVPAFDATRFDASYFKRFAVLTRRP